MCLLFQFISWSLYALRLVCLCPLHGHPQPTTWASADRVLGNYCPWRGQRVPKYRTCFWAIFFRFFALFKLLFRVHRAVFNDTSIAFYDTSMILLSAFLRSLIDCKYLSISSIIWIFQRKMRLWYFFCRKNFYVRVIGGWICRRVVPSNVTMKG